MQKNAKPFKISFSAQYQKKKDLKSFFSISKAEEQYHQRQNPTKKTGYNS